MMVSYIKNNGGMLYRKYVNDISTGFSLNTYMYVTDTIKQTVINIHDSLAIDKENERTQG